jgi:K+-sensing histidine kinase KdpD
MITSMIVHDLKNPLSTILGLTNQPEQDENIKKVRHSGKQMLNLVMNILDVQKFENARMPVNRENVLLYDLLNDALTDISPSLDEKKLTIETVGDFNRTVGVDSPLIRRVFINILSNAVKFSPLNEVIRIKAANDPETGKVAVSITDSGQGIVPEKIPHVFEKFAIINPQQEGSNRSTGLGLAFCKMAIEAHNNRIDVISEPDKFTTFRFTLDTFSVIDADTKPVVFESVSSPELVLSDRDIAFLKQHAGNITTLKHYQTGKIISALTGINGETSPGIKTWILEMEKATYTGNEQLFNTLISLIEGDHHEKNTDC